MAKINLNSKATKADSSTEKAQFKAAGDLVTATKNLAANAGKLQSRANEIIRRVEAKPGLARGSDYSDMKKLADNSNFILGQLEKHFGGI